LKSRKHFGIFCLPFKTSNNTQLNFKTYSKALHQTKVALAQPQNMTRFEPLPTGFGDLGNASNLDAATAHIKNAFKAMYQSRASEIFVAIQGNQALMMDIFPPNAPINLSGFNELVLDTNSPLYDFIKIQ